MISIQLKIYHKMPEIEANATDVFKSIFKEQEDEIRFSFIDFPEFFFRGFVQYRGKGYVAIRA
jgi:hypothetical protein